MSTFFEQIDKPLWHNIQHGRRSSIAKVDLSTGYGMYPFTVEGRATSRKRRWEAKTGTKTNLYFNKETGVQVSYSFSRVRWYDMSNPEESKTYWKQRTATKAAFFKMMGWR